MKPPSIHVADLIRRLQAMDPSKQVRVWLPGSTIRLSEVFEHDGEVRIEGNIDPGSALSLEDVS